MNSLDAGRMGRGGRDELIDRQTPARPGQVKMECKDRKPPFVCFEKDVSYAHLCFHTRRPLFEKGIKDNMKFPV